MHQKGNRDSTELVEVRDAVAFEFFLLDFLILTLPYANDPRLIRLCRQKR